MMAITGAAGAGGSMSAGSLLGMQKDPASKNLQQQIANAQKKLKEISSDGDLSLEEKMKKRQEIQQEITNLNQQLRQHQTEQRRQQQAKQTSMDDLTGRTDSTAAKPSGRGSGLSQAGMQAVLSADASMKQARVQGSTAKQMEGRANVLKAEIKQDAGRGNTEKKEAELADLQEKAQAAVSSQMSSLANANQAVEEAANTEPDSRADKDTKHAGRDDKSSKTDERSAQKADAADKNPSGSVNVFHAGKAGEAAAEESVPAAEIPGAETAAAKPAAGQMGIYTPVDIRL